MLAVLLLAAGCTAADGEAGSTPTPTPTRREPSIESASWNEAIATGDVVDVVEWYEEYTGHDGINPDDPDDLPVDEEDLTWMPDGIRSEYDGQVLEGVAANHIEIEHNNVTVRRCRVVGAGKYGALYRPTYGAPYTGNVIEFCTFSGENEDGRPVMMRPGETSDVSMTFRNNDVSGYSGGVRLENRCVAEYNYVHDQFHPPDGHAASIRLMGTWGIARRNLVAEGRSNNLAFYVDQGFMHNATYEENILGGPITMPDGRVISPEASPSYGFTARERTGDMEPYGLVFKDNWFYGGYQYGLVDGRGIPWGEDGNVRSGNRALQTFTTKSGTYEAGELLPINDE